MTEDVNLGVRHILPAYAAAFVLAGGVLVTQGPRAAQLRIGVWALLFWYGAESVVQHPHHLSYFGPQVGGATAGHKRLVDSSTDWGTGLPHLKRWLERNDPGSQTPLYLAYFGTDSPEYHGISARRLPGFIERDSFEPYPLGPGLYAISASLLQGVYTAAFGRWNDRYERMYRDAVDRIAVFERKVPDGGSRAEFLLGRAGGNLLRDYELLDNLRFARLCAWLRRSREPDHNLGNGLLIWRLESFEIEAALSGSPPEAGDGPVHLLFFRKLYSAGNEL